MSIFCQTRESSDEKYFIESHAFIECIIHNIYQNFEDYKPRLIKK